VTARWSVCVGHGNTAVDVTVRRQTDGTTSSVPALSSSRQQTDAWADGCMRHDQQCSELQQQGVDQTQGEADRMRDSSCTQTHMHAYERRTGCPRRVSRSDRSRRLCTRHPCSQRCRVSHANFCHFIPLSLSDPLHRSTRFHRSFPSSSALCTMDELTEKMSEARGMLSNLIFGKKQKKPRELVRLSMAHT